MKTQSTPSRGSTTSPCAPGFESAACSLLRLRDARPWLAIGSGSRRDARQRSRGSDRIRLDDVADSPSGGTCGSDPSGRRWPTGESPGTRNTCRAAAASARSSSAGRGAARSGAAPAGRSRPACRARARTSAPDARAPGIVELGIDGSMLTGRAASFRSQYGGVLEGGQHEVGAEAEPLRDPLGEAFARRSIVGLARLLGSAISAVGPERFAVGAPDRARTPSAAAVSPGYHLPCP